MAKLYFKYGVMGACKSAEALMCKYRYEEIGQNCVFCKPRTDTRDGERKVRSRIGLEADNLLFLDELLYDDEESISEEMMDKIARADVIIVDEAQFATKEQIDKLAKIYCDDCDVPVICYGLKTDFLGNFFEGSKRLFEIADKLEEIKQICWCGRKALFNARLSDGKIVRRGEQINLGGDDKYVALCRKHYNRGVITNPQKTIKSAPEPTP